jgi:hypothetical protein
MRRAVSRIVRRHTAVKCGRKVRRRSGSQLEVWKWIFRLSQFRVRVHMQYALRPRRRKQHTVGVGACSRRRCAGLTGTDGAEEETYQRARERGESGRSGGGGKMKEGSGWAVRR